MKNDLGYPRFGIVISKKLAKSAVKRNKKRRQIYEIIRQSLPISDSSDIVLLAKHPVMDLTFDELNRAVREILTTK
jgi:ribonuclease P protein component